MWTPVMVIKPPEWHTNDRSSAVPWEASAVVLIFKRALTESLKTGYSCWFFLPLYTIACRVIANPNLVMSIQLDHTLPLSSSQFFYRASDLPYPLTILYSWVTCTHHQRRGFPHFSWAGHTQYLPPFSKIPTAPVAIWYCIQCLYMPVLV